MRRREREKKSVLVRYVSWNVRSSKFSFLSFLCFFLLPLCLSFIPANSLDLARHLIIGFITLSPGRVLWLVKVISTDWLHWFPILTVLRFACLLYREVKKIEKTTYTDYVSRFSFSLWVRCEPPSMQRWLHDTHTQLIQSERERKRKRRTHTHTTYIRVIFHEPRTLGTFNWNQWNFLLCHGCCLPVSFLLFTRIFLACHSFILFFFFFFFLSRRAFYSPPVVS